MTMVFGLAAYNEEDSIDPLFTRIERLQRDSGPVVVLLYNDGSRDNTGAKVRSWQGRLDVRYLRER